MAESPPTVEQSSDDVIQVHTDGNRATNNTTADKAEPANPLLKAGSARGDDDKLPDKELLERRKLAIEIREIKARNRTIGRTFFQNEVRTWVALAGGLLTGVGAIITVWIQGSNYLDQRESESKFRINSEIIALVNQLNDTVPARRENAAMMLAFFDERPVPILINQLDVPGMNNENYPDPLIIRKSLELIIKQDSTNVKFVDGIIQQLIDESNTVFERELANTKNFSALDNFVEALLLLKHVRADKIQKVLNDLKSKAPNSQLPEYQRKYLMGKLK